MGFGNIGKVFLGFQLILLAQAQENPIQNALVPHLYPTMVDGPPNRIVGGEDAGLHEFPGIISLQMQKLNGNYNHSCTGSIVNENWMVTAGHCSFGPQNRFRAVAGAHNLYNFTGSEQLRGLKAIIRHPMLFLPPGVLPPDYDIAMMMFDEPLDFSQPEFVSPTALAPTGFTTTGSGVAAGWGLTNQQVKAVPAVLQKAPLPVMEYQKCKAEYPQTPKRFFCAGGVAGQNVCNGDSGGPFYVALDDAPLTMSGLTSYSPGIECAKESIPAMFTDASQFRSWIDCVSKFTKPPSPFDNLNCM